MINLNGYEDYVKAALEQYDRLPQETSEIYKKHFVNIPFDLKKYSQAAIAETNGSSELADALNNGLKELKVKFDALIGSGSHVLNSNFSTIRIQSASELDPSRLRDTMHNAGEDKFVAYIQAYSKDIVFVDVPDGKTANINILFQNSDAPLTTQLFVNVGEGAKLNLFEFYTSKASKTSALGVIHEITAAAGSNVEINALHNEDQNTIALAFAKDKTAQTAHLRFNALYNGGLYTRVRNRFEASKHSSAVDINEVVFGSSAQKFDISTFIVNAEKETQASLDSKAALMDTSFCIFKGFAKILHGASKSKSYVHERGILLDRGAKVDGLPDLSVDENDVKATHSSATSPVDPEAVFYLMSKGISELQVRKLLVTGFFASSIAKIENNVMKELSMSLINDKLQEKKFGHIPKPDIRGIWAITSDVQSGDIFKGHYKYRGAE